MAPVGDRLQSEQRDAIDHYLARCTVPLVQEGHGQAAILGTANLFRWSDRIFLVTAAHSFEDSDPETVGIPGVEPNGRRAFFTLNDCRRAYWPDPRLDVSIVEVIGTRLREAIQRTGYAYIGPEDVPTYGSTFARYVLVGFPRAIAVASGENIWPRAIKITTDAYEGPVPDNFSPRRELLLTHEMTSEASTGETVETPLLHGMSGAAVWGVSTEQPQGLWQSTQHVKLVGVQTACKHGSYIRAHQWWLVARMFEQIDQELGELLMRRLEPA